MKKYAVIVDISPSEQINENEDELRFMALVFGLKSPKSFDEVGANYPIVKYQLQLKKWSSASKGYKRKFIKHAEILSNTGKIIFGLNITSNTIIRKTGIQYWESLMGRIPAPSSFSQRGRPRIKMGGYRVDGKILLPPWEILIDDLAVLGWYAEALVGCLSSLVEVNSEDVKLDALIDRLPNEQGGEDFYKATLLRQICKKGSNNLLNIAGVPENSDTMQRDLLVDNMAGLANEINNNPNSQYKGATSLYRFNRRNI